MTTEAVQIDQEPSATGPDVSAIFTPFGIVLGLGAGQLAKKIFALIRGLIDDEEAPRPKHRELP